jgi:hypothetical protein
MKIEPGDKVLFSTSPQHVSSGIVASVDGEYVNVVCRKGIFTFMVEKYRREIQHIVSKGNPIPQTDHQQRQAIERKALRRNLAQKLAEVYLGRTVTMGFIMGDATGGEVFLRQADAALELMGR